MPNAIPFALINLGVPFATAFQISGALLNAAVQLAGAVVLNSISNALFQQKPKQQDLRQRLAVPTELPSKRFVYGHCFATGTPLPQHAENGYLYQCFLLNSRHSEGNFELYLDNRAITLEGDPYDLTGPGGTPVSGSGLLEGNVQVWFALGDQTSPPAEFIADAPYDVVDRPLGYKTSDAGQGTTLVWLKAKRGDKDDVLDRWPSRPNVGVTVEGDFSKVWDPRDAAQSATDTSTHTFSRNQALCLLDLLLQNPFRTYSDADLVLQTWVDGADICDEIIERKNGGSEARYEAAGTVVFNGAELEQLSAPLEEAGASRVARSGGRLSYIPGVALDVTHTVTEMVNLPDISLVRPPEERFDVVHCDYSPIARDGEPASLPPWPIPGVVQPANPAVLSLDLSMVSSDGQAQRIRKITGLQSTYGRTMQGVAFGDAMDLTAGSWAATSLGYSQMDGTFQVMSANPLAYPDERVDGGCALRIPLTLRETSADIYAWDKAEEVDITHPPFVYDDEGTQPPGPTLNITTGAAANLDTGGTIIPRALITADPSPSSGVEQYEWQWAIEDEPYNGSVFTEGSARDTNGDIFNYFVGTADVAHKVRVKARTLTGASDWVETTGVTPTVVIDLDLPTVGTITEPSAGIVEIPVTVPNDPDAAGVELYAGPDSDVANASAVGSPVFASQNSVVTFQESGLGSGVTRHYFVRTRGSFGSASDFTASASFTTA